MGIGLCYVFGLAAALYLPTPFTWLFGLAFLLLALSIPLLRYSAACIPLMLCILLTGWMHTSLFFASPSGRVLDRLIERPSEHVEVIGMVSDDPICECGFADNETQYTFTLKVEGIRRVTQWQRTVAALPVEWVRQGVANHPPEYGDRWLMRGVIRNPSTSNRRIRDWSFSADPEGAACLAKGRGSEIVSWCLQSRRRCAEILGEGLASFPEQANVLRALLLGYRQALPAELSRDFSVTGTIHIFAISGSHVVVFACLLIIVLKATGLSKDRWIFLLGPLLLLYTIGTGMEASAVRSCIMAIVFWFGVLFRREPDSLSALAFSALLILGFMPSQGLDLGFIFSFSAVLGLILFYPVISRPLLSSIQKHPWMIGPDHSWQAKLRTAAGYVIGVSMMTLVAWLVSAPLTAQFFNLFSPIALLANLLVVPMSFVIMLTGCLSLTVGAWIPLLAEIFNHANRIFLSFTLVGIDAAASIPGGHSLVCAPGWLAIVEWYLLLICLFLWRGWPRWVASAIIGFALLWPLRSTTSPMVDIHILDVGHGNAAFVNVPGSGDVMVDVGPRYSARRVISFLRRQGVDRLKSIILTHADVDHAGAALNIMNQIKVDELWLSPFPGRSPVLRDVLRQAKACGIRTRRLEAGDHGRLEGDVEWDIIHPAGKKAESRADDGSLVIRFAREASSVLFMGGAGEKVETQLLDRKADTAATVLVAGNHGASNTCSSAWLKAVHPRYVLVSVGRGNTEGMPAKETLQRFMDGELRYLRTDESGDIGIRFPLPGQLGRTNGLVVTSALNPNPQ